MIVFYDGVCHLCDQTVQFVLRHDPAGQIRFAALQSTYARVLLEKQHGFKLSDPPESIVVFEDERLYTESTGALRIARKLPTPWKWLFVFILVPKPIRDAVYRFIARNRYRWFGRQDSCLLPDPKWKSRFIDSE